MVVDIHPDALAELLQLELREQNAVRNALRKLEVAGNGLRYPHCSAVRSVGATLRELRPRQGRSAWRALYRRVGDRMIVAAIGPEASVDRAGFERAVRAALDRLAREK